MSPVVYPLPDSNNRQKRREWKPEDPEAYEKLQGAKTKGRPRGIHSHRSGTGASVPESSPQERKRAAKRRKRQEKAWASRSSEVTTTRVPPEQIDQVMQEARSSGGVMPGLGSPTVTATSPGRTGTR